MAFIVILFYVVGVLFIFGGIGSCAMAKGAVHEIGGLVSLLIGFGLIVGSAVVQKLIEISNMIRASAVLKSSGTDA